MMLARYAILTMLFLTVTLAVVSRPAIAAEETTLVEAVKQGNRSAVATLLGQPGLDVNALEPDGTTALHWAAHRGDLDTVHRLIDAGANVHVANRYGIAPIWLAAQDGHVPVVEALLSAGADSDTTRGDSGESVVMITARAGHADVLRRLVAHGADVNAKGRIRSQTALMWAAAERHPEAVRVLAAAGADLEARSSTGITSLLFAIRAGDIPTTEALLDEGADITTTAPPQQHHEDGMPGHTDLASIAPGGTTALVLAIINAHWELAAYLVEHGADPNGNDPVHGRPLQALAMVRRAVNRGLSPTLPRRPTGQISAIELAEVLVAHGAIVDDPIDWSGRNYTPPHMSLPFFFTISYVGATPLFIASKNGDVAFMQFLIANGADLELATAQGVTPLLAAAGIGHSVGETPETPEEALEAVQLLYALGSDLGAPVVDPRAAAAGRGRSRRGGVHGMNVLHGAVLREAPELLKWLIEHDAPLGHKNAAGKTAFESVYQLSLSTTRLSRELLGDILREALIERGLPVPVVAITNAQY